MSYKTISEKRREMLYIQKHGLDKHIEEEEDEEENAAEKINYTAGRRHQRSTVKQRRQNVKDIVGR